MSSVDPYINLIIAMLGLAYPILLQVIARLDERYESENIAVLFKTEWEWKAFRYTLMASLILIFIWSLKREPLIEIEGLNYFIENSAAILLTLSTILLVISFFFFVNKILKYYTLYTLIPYLIKEHKRSESETKYFSALSDLLLLSIKKQQTNPSRTLSDFFYAAFRKIRDKHKNEPVIYPEIYYETVYKAIEELAILKEKRNYLLEKQTSGGSWLLGELQGKEISERTYFWLWQNLKLAERYQLDDLIFYHWENCHQYYSNCLPYIHSEYDELTNSFQVSNQETIDKRKDERSKFIEFHYALGGLLIYKARYRCLRRFFNYTQSQPPKYELLPESMNEIFKFYFDVRDPYERVHTWISYKYPFPELSGLNADYEIKKWIMSYMAILFLRQYTIYPHLIHMEPLAFPGVPGTQGEIKQWIDGMDFFKSLVEEHLKNSEVLNILKLDFITSQWCIENEKPFPTDFLETFKGNLVKAYHTNALTLPLSDEKVVQFENVTKAIIESAFIKLQSISNAIPVNEDNCDKWYANGERTLQSKDAFSDHPESHHSNFDSFLAYSISNNLMEALGVTFLSKRTKSFLFRQEDIFKAIDRLEIDDAFVIINFGIKLDYISNQFNIKNLSTDKYRNTAIHSFNPSHVIRDSLFILKKSDLPNITTIPIKEDLINKYSLKRISSDIDLYSSVIDLNLASTEVYNEVKENISDDEVRKSALLCVIISIEFKWKKNIEVIQLRKYSEFSQSGLVNKLEDM